MRMIKRGKQCGCNEYEIRDSFDIFVGWLFRKYSPWITPFGKEPAYFWELELHCDSAQWHKYDDTEWTSFKEAKEWLVENVR